MKRRAIQIHPDDNVAVALSPLQPGESVPVGSDDFLIAEPIAPKHKFTLTSLDPGDPVYMYGVLVGKATKPIEKGGLLAVSNVKHATNEYSIRERHTSWLMPDVTKWKDRTFNGFHRSDGSVGTANYWIVVPLVFCENRNVDVIREAFMKELGYQQNTTSYQSLVRSLAGLYRSGITEDQIAAAALRDVVLNEKPQRLFPNVDGIKFLNHTMGCGGTRSDARALCGLLAGYITHPNVAGATVLSLGCQNAQFEILEEEIKLRDPNFDRPFYFLEQQKIGLETDLLREAIIQTFTGLIRANENKRKPAPISKICMGLECGGSDGFSGISANPAVGYASDLLVALGGTVILSEFPELCGVEQELSDRCVDESLARRLGSLMQTYNERAKAVGSGFDANPSPGNIKDGLITDAIKSAGAAKKGGTSPITDVLDYPEKATKPGLNLLCTPGSDVESTTAEVGSGANVVLFTTGLGTPTGNPIAPVVKISTNTPMFNKMKDIIDIDTGTIIDGVETIEQAGERILEYVIAVAEGRIVPKAVALEHDDFIPWKRGVSL
jgi:altronate hydrolase